MNQGESAMQYPLAVRRRSLSQNSLVRFGILIFVCAVLCAGRLNAQTVATYDFEDGTAQGWTSFNGAITPGNTTAAAYTGTNSLLTTTSSAGQGGPAIPLTAVLQAASQYSITTCA